MRHFPLVLAAALALGACAPAAPTTPATSASASPGAGAASTAPSTPVAGTSAAPTGTTSSAPQAASGASITVDGTTYTPVSRGEGKYGVGKNERMAIYAGSINDQLTAGKTYSYVALKGDLKEGFTVADVDAIENVSVTIVKADGTRVGYLATEPGKVSDLVIESSTGDLRGTYTANLAAWDDKGKRIGTDLHKVVYRFDVAFPAAQ